LEKSWQAKMVKLNKIYTKTGDKGTTGLISGRRRKKFDLRINTFGSVDEANAQVGKIRLLTKNMPKFDNMLARIQSDLFDLGSDLANPKKDTKKEIAAKKNLRTTPHQVKWIEEQIDYYNADLAPLKTFVLPAGTALAVEFHISRTIVRRAERLVAELINIEPQTSPFTLHYLNRLSDLFFVMSRIANNNGKDDVLWTPGRFSGNKKSK